tara:strand:+ start:1525 stop:4500 length:2976 start_codon:yes stop_codon:yes gene_type:complete
MASVTQRIQSYTGGVSKQTDDKKFPGQVTEALNSYPDPTFGLQKRPGLKFLTALKDSSNNNITGNTLDNAKWFYIHRANDEKYIGCIAGNTTVANNAIHIWNATTNVKSTITYDAPDWVATTAYVVGNKVKNDSGKIYTCATAGTSAGSGGPTGTGTTIADNTVRWDYTTTESAKSYLHNSAISKDDYHILTVQDTSIITNKEKTVSVATPTTFYPDTRATIRVMGVEYSSNYNVTIKQGGTTYKTTDNSADDEKVKTYNADAFTANATTYDTKLNADWILTKLKAAIEARNVPNLTVTKLETSLELTSSNNTSFSIQVSGGVSGKQLTVFQDAVNNVSDLPTQAVHNRAVKIINTSNANDAYYSRFVANDGTSGTGYWEEALGWDEANQDEGGNTTPINMSVGLTASTMPHELVNTGTNAFTFRTITWTARLVGDDTTNSHPSFNGAKIQQAFFYNNRLGFLTQDNVSMSQSGEFYNFYHITAQTLTASDPIDLSCSSIRPAVLHGIIPVASGLVLFSENQQFLMYSADGNLSPSTAIIRGLSNYEMDTKIDPVDVGTNINFISKTPAYTRVFGMTPRGEGQIPLVRDVGKVVSEYIPETIDHLIASPQNSFIALYSSTDTKVYFYRTHSDGQEEVLQTWFNWELPGNVQDFVVDSDVLYTVVKQSNGYQLLSANLSATPEDEILVTQSGIQLNPYMDFYAKAASVSYDAATETSKCYLPYSDITTLEPIILIAGGAADADSGFTQSPTKGSDGTGPYFAVKNKDFSSIATKVIVGFRYNYDVTLPKTYFQLDKGVADYTAHLTISRMKFSVGRSSTIGFKMKSKGYRGHTQTFTGDGTTKKFSPDYKVQDKSNVKVKKNGQVITTGFTLTDHDTLPDHITVEFTNAPVAATTAAQNVNGTVPDPNANLATAADTIEIYIDNWYDIQPVQETNEYLADDVPMSDQDVFTVPIHQRTDNFTLRVFSDSPFPVSLTSMMWEGNYHPRYYRRT